MSNRRNIQFTYTPHNKATLLDCSFIVDSANGNGYGARSFKGSGRVKNVFMHTTASFTGTTHTGTMTIDSISPITSTWATVGMPVQTTDLPAGAVITSIVSSTSIKVSVAATTGHAGATVTYQAPGSPNPAAGYIVVDLADNYNRYLGGFSGMGAPVSGSPILVANAGVTAGLAYTIVSLGTTTTAGWQSLGLPTWQVPAVGVSFIANVTATAAGTGAVEVPAAAGCGVFNMCLIGDPNLMNGQSGTTNGMRLIFACYSDSSADAPTLGTPADGSVVGMTFYMNDSAQGV